MDPPDQVAAPAAQLPRQLRARERRIRRHNLVFAQRLDTNERSSIRIDLVNSSGQGLGLHSLIPLPTGTHLALSITAPDAAPELLLCSIQHCTKLRSGYFVLGAKILARMPGHLNATRLPKAWYTAASLPTP